MEHTRSTDRPEPTGGHDHRGHDDTRNGFRHDALTYDSPEQLAAIAGPWLLEGLTAGDAAVIAVAPEKAELLRSAVGDDPRVLAIEHDALYRPRTASAISTFRKLGIESAAAGRGARVVGEVDFGATAAEWHEWQRYEAVINEAFAPFPLWGLCVFNSLLPGPLLATARHTHPHLRTVGGRSVNRDYVDPVSYLASLPCPEEPLERTPPTFAADHLADFSALRSAVSAQLAGVAAPRDLAEDFGLAVDEMASNAVRHGRAPASLRLWTRPGTLVCTIGDAGDGPTDPFAGYGPAHGDDLSAGGMGLWLARQLCDQVALRRDEQGNTVRLTTHWN